MLMDLLLALMDAKTEREKAEAYENLRLVGMDRRTANYCIREIKEINERRNKHERR